MAAAFGILKAGPAPREQRLAERVAVTLVLLCILFVMVTMLHSLFAGPDVKSASRAARAANMPSVKVVAATPQTDRPCGEQTWPYIDSRCLTLVPPKPAAATPAESTGKIDRLSNPPSVALPESPRQPQPLARLHAPATTMLQVALPARRDFDRRYDSLAYDDPPPMPSPGRSHRRRYDPWPVIPAIRLFGRRFF